MDLEAFRWLLTADGERLLADASASVAARDLPASQAYPVRSASIGAP